jgi:hypothetical protein
VLCGADAGLVAERLESALGEFISGAHEEKGLPDGRSDRFPLGGSRGDECSGRVAARVDLGIAVTASSASTCQGTSTGIDHLTAGSPAPLGRSASTTNPTTTWTSWRSPARGTTRPRPTTALDRPRRHRPRPAPAADRPAPASFAQRSADTSTHRGDPLHPLDDRSDLHASRRTEGVSHAGSTPLPL